MRCVNKHTASIDGVAPGAVGDFQPEAVKVLLAAGLLVPVDGAPSPAAESDELALARVRILELEAEVTQLRADLEAATAPKKGRG